MIRYEYLDSSVRESDLHPDGIFIKEREMGKAFIDALTVGGSVKEWSGQPGKMLFFNKWGVSYVIDRQDWSVQIGTMPEEGDIRNYYHDSELARFRASRDYQDMVTKTRGNIWELQIDWIAGRVQRYLGKKKVKVLDCGTKFVGWAEKLSVAGFVDSVAIKDPLPPILPTELPGDADVVLMMDDIQRQSNPRKALAMAAERLRKGGIMLLSCRSGTGIDILTLREHSDSVFPLDHIFMPSPGGLAKLLESVDLEVLELTTPGLLDMQYLKNQQEDIGEEQWFQRYLLSVADEGLLERFQGFLQQNNLSSHLRAVARKS